MAAERGILLKGADVLETARKARFAFFRLFSLHSLSHSSFTCCNLSPKRTWSSEEVKASFFPGADPQNSSDHACFVDVSIQISNIRRSPGGYESTDGDGGVVLIEWMV